MSSGNNRFLKECSWLPLDDMKNSTVLVTGGTGLVGYDLICALAAVREEYQIRILALVRDLERAKKKFAPLGEGVELVLGDVTKPIPWDGPVDYVIHGAAITSSKSFVEMPVETILTAIEGTRNVLEFARNKNVRSVVYMSSMEAYGSPQTDRLLTEEDVDYLNPLSLRSSYPESKRMCENLCVAYAKEYAVPVKIARLAVTFGPRIHPTDRRALIQFIRSALDQKNIEIKTSGNSARMYLYTADSTSALLTLLLKGENGQAYNLADKDTYCSVRKLAELVVQVTESKARVLTDTGSEEEKGMYPPDSFLRLDTSKLEALGWYPRVSLGEGLKQLAKSLKENV